MAHDLTSHDDDSPDSTLSSMDLGTSLIPSDMLYNKSINPFQRFARNNKKNLLIIKSIATLLMVMGGFFTALSPFICNNLDKIRICMIISLSVASIALTILILTVLYDVLMYSLGMEDVGVTREITNLTCTQATFNHAIHNLCRDITDDLLLLQNTHNELVETVMYLNAVVALSEPNNNLSEDEKKNPDKGQDIKLPNFDEIDECVPMEDLMKTVCKSANNSKHQDMVKDKNTKQCLSSIKEGCIEQIQQIEDIHAKMTDKITALSKQVQHMPAPPNPLPKFEPKKPTLRNNSPIKNTTNQQTLNNTINNKLLTTKQSIPRISVIQNRISSNAHLMDSDISHLRKMKVAQCNVTGQNKNQNQAPESNAATR